MRIEFYNKLKKLDYKNKIIILICFFILAIFLFINFIFLISKTEIEKLLYNIQDQKIDLEKKYNRSQKSRNEAEKNRKVDEELLVLSQAFINKNRSLEFITALEDLSVKCNVTQKINLLSPVPVNTFYEKVGLQLNTYGSFENLMSYLVKIDALGYYVNIDLLEIKDIPGGSDKVMNILANTYWQK